MMQAIGSNKPWVRRGLRTWYVSHDPGQGVSITWFGGKTRCYGEIKKKTFNRSKTCRRQCFRISNKIMSPVWQELLRGVENERINPDWIEIRFENEWRARIPTDLVIESLRLMLRYPVGPSTTSSTIYSKRARRRVSRMSRWFLMGRKSPKKLGSHARWMLEARRKA